MGYRQKSLADQYLEANPNSVPNYVPQALPPVPVPQVPINLNVPSPLDPMQVAQVATQSLVNQPQVPLVPNQVTQSQPPKVMGEKPMVPQDNISVPQGPMFMPLETSQTSTTSSTSTQGLDKASQERYKEAFDLNQEAIEQREDFDTKKAQQEALSKQELAALSGNQIQEQQDLREAEKRAQLAAQKEMDKTAQEALNYEFDQNRVWKRMGTAGSITAGIGIALGALAQGFGAKSNAAIDVMDKNIQRDIEQQRMEYEKIKDKSRAQESAYGRLRQMGLDDRQAQESIHKAAMEKTRLGIEAGLLKKLGPEEAKVKSFEATSKAEENYANKMETKFSKNTGSTTQVNKEMKHIPGMTGQGLRDYDGKLLSGDQAQKVGFLDQTLTQLQRMKSFINKGQSRHMPIGDNDFTIAMRIAAENYGRKQSGGAINKDEEARFRDLMRGFFEGDEKAIKRIEAFEKGLLGERKTITRSPFQPYYEDSKAPVGNVK
jgi:hypothetical protein